MRPVLEQLQAQFPHLIYTAGAAFAWSPATGEIRYGNPDDPHAAWSLLHETAHALLAHRAYATDLELLLLETAAWKRAEGLAGSLEIAIDQDHIEDCLDTYRDWLHARSRCPRCNTAGLQYCREYRCFNCHARWQVTEARFCRPYRTGGRGPDATLPFADVQQLSIM